MQGIVTTDGEFQGKSASVAIVALDKCLGLRIFAGKVILVFFADCLEDGYASIDSCLFERFIIGAIHPWSGLLRHGSGESTVDVTEVATTCVIAGFR